MMGFQRRLEVYVFLFLAISHLGWCQDISSCASRCFPSALKVCPFSRPVPDSCRCRGEGIHSVDACVRDQCTSMTGVYYDSLMSAYTLSYCVKLVTKVFGPIGFHTVIASDINAAGTGPTVLLTKTRTTPIRTFIFNSGIDPAPVTTKWVVSSISTLGIAAASLSSTTGTSMTLPASTSSTTSDTGVMSTSNSTGGTSHTSVISSTDSVGETSDQTEPTKSSGSGLSTKAKLGIGLGVTLGGIVICLIAGAAYLFGRGHNSRRDSPRQSMARGEAAVSATHEKPSEIDGNQIYEAPSRGGPYELP